MRQTGILVLEDGSTFPGQPFGARGVAVGEVVFNTSLFGYQQILTDPSYCGQIVVMTCPHVGNVGINWEDVESGRPQVAGFVVRALSPVVSSWRATSSLQEYLTAHNVPGLSGVDTRALTRVIRVRGAMKAALSTDPTVDPVTLQGMAVSWSGLAGRDTVREVACGSSYRWDSGCGIWQPHGFVADRQRRTHVVVYDFGVKWSILRRLADRGCRITVVPAYTPAEDALALSPDGVLFSNGPGDPAGLPVIVDIVRAFLDSDTPLFGICLGHQLLGLALGGRTFKLRFGHHGSNHPVIEVSTGRVLITSQNHNYAVDPDSLDPQQVEITHLNLNDGTVEGMALRGRPVFSVQFHPEANPGPHDGDALFDRWVRALVPRA